MPLPCRRLAAHVATLALVLPRGVAAAPPTVADSSLTIVSADSAWTIDARRLEFGAAVLGCAWDSARAVAYVQIQGEAAPSRSISAPPSPTPQLLAYDTRSRLVRWKVAESGAPWTARDNRLALQGRKGFDLLEAESGRRDEGWPSGSLLLVRADLRISVSDDEVAAFDGASGRRVWSSSIESFGNIRGTLVAGESLFVCGDGLKSVDLRSGLGWEFATSSRRGVAGGLASATFGALGRHYGIPGYWGYEPDWVRSGVFVDARRAFFAAESVIVCVDRASGRGLWRQRVAPDSVALLYSRALGGNARNEVQGALLLGDGGEYLFALSLGWTTGPGDHLFTTAPASLALLDRESGRTVRRSRVAGGPVATGAFRWRGNTIVVTPNELCAYDSLLRLVDSFTIPRPAEFRLAMAADSLILALTTSEVLALHGDSLRVL